MESAGVLDGGFGPKPMVPTMPPFSWLGRSFFIGREKRIPGNMFDVGIGEKIEYLGLAWCGVL